MRPKRRICVGGRRCARRHPSVAWPLVPVVIVASILHIWVAPNVAFALPQQQQSRTQTGGATAQQLAANRNNLFIDQLLALANSTHLANLNDNIKHNSTTAATHLSQIMVAKRGHQQSHQQQDHPSSVPVSRNLTQQQPQQLQRTATNAITTSDRSQLRQVGGRLAATELTLSPSSSATVSQKRRNAQPTGPAHSTGGGGLPVPRANLSGGQISQQHNASIASVRQRWGQMERSLGESLLAAGAQLRLNLEELVGGSGGQFPQQQPISISADCRLSLLELADGLGQQRLWASQMLDASARLPSGLLEGTLTELGHYDQCIAIGSTATAAAPGGSPRGQYCSLVIKPPLTARPRLHTVCQPLPALATVVAGGLLNRTLLRPLGLLAQNSQQFHYVGLRLGVCTPSRCTRADVQQLLSGFLAKFQLLGQVKSCQVARSNERTSTEPKLDSVQQYIVLALSAVLVLAAIGTCLDLTSFGGGSASSSSSSSSRAAVAAAGAAKPSVAQALLDETMASVRVDSLVMPAATSTAAATTAGQKRKSKTKANGKSKSGNSNNKKERERAYGKRWRDYQVYRSAANSDCHSLGPQRNPLAEPSTVKGEQLLADESFEEAWIARLERNQMAAERQRRRPPRPPPPTSGSCGGGDGWRLAARSLLLCFSIRRNLRTIGKHVGGSASSSSACNIEHGAAQATVGDINVIHGLRTLTMVWIIFGHTIGLVSPEMMNNLFSLAHLSCSSRLLQALLNATLAVNTFFMISGLVTVISFGRKCKSAMRLIGSSTGSNKYHDTCTGRAGNKSSKACQNNKRRATGEPESGKSSSSSGAKQRSLICDGGGGGAGHFRLQSGSNQDHTEVWSVDSTSIISSLSSSASSNRCIGDQLKRGANASRASRWYSRRNSNSSSSSSGEDSTGNNNGRRAGSAPSTWPADFQPLFWLLMRYLRLTPAYATVIGLTILLPALGSGPFWDESVGQMGPVCRQNWWLNLFYVNNFLETDKLCMIHSWYLSNEWQFFSLALLLFGLVYLSKKIVLLLLVSLFVASSAATFALTVANDFPPTIVTTSPAVAERWLFIHALYYKPWPHLPSYLIGLVAGYCILIKERIRIGPLGRALIWLLASLLALSLLNSIYPWNMGVRVEPLLAGLHSATFRSLWALCCAWLVFALASRPKSPLSRLLGWHGFQVTSRLTYCAYLVHPLVIYYHFGTLRERLDSSPYGQLHRFMATLAMSYLCALLLSLLVEAPSVQMQHYLASLRNGADGCQEEHQRGAKGGGGAAGSTSSATTAGSSTSTDSSFGGCEGRDNSASSCSFITRAESFKMLVTDGANGASSAGYCLHDQLSPASGEHQQAADNPANGRSRQTAAEGSLAALDADFQRKLAQAIGRGFRIRSKIANGTIKQQQHLHSQVVAVTPRRLAGQARRLPGEAIAAPAAAVAHLLAGGGGGGHQAPATTEDLASCSSQQRSSPGTSALLATRTKRAAELGTFVGSSNGGGGFGVGGGSNGYLNRGGTGEVTEPLDSRETASKQRRRSYDLNGHSLRPTAAVIWPAAPSEMTLRMMLKERAQFAPPPAVSRSQLNLNTSATNTTTTNNGGHILDS